MQNRISRLLRITGLLSVFAAPVLAEETAWFPQIECLLSGGQRLVISTNAKEGGNERLQIELIDKGGAIQKKLLVDHKQSLIKNSVEAMEAVSKGQAYFMTAGGGVEIDFFGKPTSVHFNGSDQNINLEKCVDMEGSELFDAKSANTKAKPGGAGSTRDRTGAGHAPDSL